MLYAIYSMLCNLYVLQVLSLVEGFFRISQAPESVIVNHLTFNQLKMNWALI